MAASGLAAIQQGTVPVFIGEGNGRRIMDGTYEPGVGLRRLSCERGDHRAHARSHSNPPAWRRLPPRRPVRSPLRASASATQGLSCTTKRSLGSWSGISCMTDFLVDASPIRAAGQFFKAAFRLNPRDKQRGGGPGPGRGGYPVQPGPCAAVMLRGQKQSAQAQGRERGKAVLGNGAWALSKTP
jgi:hypothetical protein